MRRWTYLVCSALVLGSIATAAGEPYPQCVTKPTEADQKAAKSLFTAGQISFNEADYKTAIQYWRDSYKRDCTAHLLLLNLARAFELNGDKREAVQALKTYLDRQPNSPDKPQIQRRIENLESQLSGPQPTATGTPDSGAPAPTTPLVGTAAPTGTVAPVPTGTTEQPATSGGRSILPWIVVGAGGVAAIVGGVVWLGGNSKVNDADAICPDHKCPTPDRNLPAAEKAALQSKYDAAKEDGNSGRNSMLLGGVIFGVGLAGVAGGLVWQFAFNKPKPDSTATGITNIAPAVGPNYSGLSLQGQF